MIQNDRDPQVEPFPTKLIGIAALATLAVFAWLSWFVYDEYQIVQDTNTRIVGLERIRGDIVHLDEVLTMSASMAAATGDVAWIERYRRFEPKLDTAIKKAIDIARRPDIADAIHETDAANIELVRMENQAFELVSERKLEEARAILSGKRYSDQKQVYASGMEKLLRGLGAEREAAVGSQRTSTLGSILAMAVVAAVIIVAWLLILGRVREWRAAMSKNVSDLVRAEEALRKSHDNLERRVADRTRELEDEIAERTRAEEELAAANGIIKAQKERMESELNVGHEIQMSFVPDFSSLPDRTEFSICATLEPAREVGGDFYDSYFLDEERFCFCIADVSGKGVPAALFMAMAKTLIKSRADDDRSIASILTHVNDELSVDNPNCMFVTVFAGILNIRSGELVYTNAGHNPPYIRRKDGALQRLDKRHGPAIGAMEGMVYKEETDTLEPGDLLFLYTDGVTEAMDIENHLFSEDRLKDLLTAKSTKDVQTAVDHTVAAVRAFEGEAEQTDDITVLALEFHGRPADALRAEQRITIKNRMPEIAAVNETFEAFAKEFGIPAAIAMKFNVIFEELLNNIVTYAYSDDDEHDIEVRMGLAGKRLTVTITDDGVPFNPLSAEAPDTDVSLEAREIGGLGIHLVRNLIDDVSYNRRIGKNVMILMKHLEREGRVS